MKRFFYRMFQGVMRIGMYFLAWRKPKMLMGEGSISEVPEIFLTNNIKSVLLVTDKGIVQHKLHLSLVKGLKEADIQCVVYHKTMANPTIDNIEEGLEIYKNNNCKGLIALGGGSPMDCAKGIGARVARPKKSISQMRGLLKVGRKIPLLVAIPTTAGTGSETTVAAVIKDSRTHEKYAINDTHLIPRYAVLDPTLTLTLPRSLTASTGMDALTHAIEAYIGKGNTASTKQSAEEATQLVFESLPKVVKDGENILARQNMQRASFLAGLAFTRAYVGNVHAIAHTLGGQYGVPHGLANAIILPYVLEYYGKSIYKKIDQLCEKVGLFVKVETPQKRTRKFIEHIRKMNKSFGIGGAIPELKKEDIPLLCKRADKEANPLYPVPKIFTLEDFENIYNMILEKESPSEKVDSTRLKSK